MNPPPDTQPLLVDSNTARAMLRLGERKFWELAACDAIPSVRIGTLRRFSPVELKAWVELGAPTAPGSADRVRRAARERR